MGGNRERRLFVSQHERARKISSIIFFFSQLNFCGQLSVTNSVRSFHSVGNALTWHLDLVRGKEPECRKCNLGI